MLVRSGDNGRTVLDTSNIPAFENRFGGMRHFVRPNALQSQNIAASEIAVTAQLGSVPKAAYRMRGCRCPLGATVPYRDKWLWLAR